MPSNIVPGQYPMIGTIFDPSQFSVDITMKIYSKLFAWHLLNALAPVCMKHGDKI